jgi:hypothetical protein
LSEIAERAASAETSTVDLLRQLKIVAARAQLPPLADWINHELGGYPKNSAVPAYRGAFQVEVHGNYNGPMGMHASNVLIAPLMIKKEYCEGLFTVTFTEGVASIEDLLRSGESVFHVPWSADAVGRFESVLLRPGAYGYGTPQLPWKLVAASRTIPRGIVTNVAAAIRDRVLDLALELERIHPDIAQTNEESTRTQQINSITAIIYGNVAIGSSDFEQLTKMEIPANQETLFARLRDYGIGEEALNELETAMAEDAEATAGKARLGAKVARWLGKHADTAIGAGVSAAGSGAGAAVTQLVLGFLSS